MNQPRSDRKTDDFWSDPEIWAELVSALVAIIVFFGCWVYAVAEAGWFLGLAFGWIPSVIIAAIAHFVARMFWWLILIGAFFLLIQLLK